MSDTLRGYRPYMVASILDENLETLKYWREHLIPGRQRAFYTGRELLALRILKVLRRENWFTPKRLKEYPLRKLFDFCNTTSLPAMRKLYLVLDESSHTIRFVDIESPPDPRERKQSYLYLDQVLDEHFEDVLNLGV